MATTITSDNFDTYFKQALSNYGKAEESESDVPTVEASSLTDAYSLPLVKNDNGLLSYEKVGMEDFMTEIASEVSEDGMLQSITEEQFNEIFY